MERRQASAPASGGRRKPPYSVARPAPAWCGTAYSTLAGVPLPLFLTFVIATPSEARGKQSSSLPCRSGLLRRFAPRNDAVFANGVGITRARTRRENGFLFHLSPEGRGRVSGASEGEAVRKLQSFSNIRTPSPQPSPLRGEGARSRRSSAPSGEAPSPHPLPARGIITLTQQTQVPTTLARDRLHSTEIEVTPAMIEAGREAFDRWMDRWDYLANGVPLGNEVSLLLASIFRGMYCKKPSRSR